MKKLLRSNTNRVFFGVCGGIGEYINLDPTIVRLIFAFLALSGMSIIVYIVMALVIPQA